MEHGNPRPVHANCTLASDPKHVRPSSISHDLTRFKTHSHTHVSAAIHSFNSFLASPPLLPWQILTSRCSYNRTSASSSKATNSPATSINPIALSRIPSCLIIYLLTRTAQCSYLIRFVPYICLKDSIHFDLPASHFSIFLDYQDYHRYLLQLFLPFDGVSAHGTSGQVHPFIQRISSSISLADSPCIVILFRFFVQSFLAFIAAPYIYIASRIIEQSLLTNTLEM